MNTKGINVPETAVYIPNSKAHWIDVNGDVYAVDGRNGRNGIIKKVQTTTHGYKYCRINYEDIGSVSKRVHRLVAEAYIPNPENKPMVGHKNNIKSDNRVENLYWTDAKENTQKAHNDGLIINAKGFEDSQSKPVNMYKTTTNELLGTYGSIIEASKETGIEKTTISRQAKYKRPVRKPYYFRYVDDEDCQTPNKIIGCFNFNTDELVGIYYNEAEASVNTGVNVRAISTHLVKGRKPKWVQGSVYFRYI